jgi:hypothetical protein
VPVWSRKGALGIRPDDILRLQSIEALSRYIVDEAQDVDRRQGVKINAHRSDRASDVALRADLR